MDTSTLVDVCVIGLVLFGVVGWALVQSAKHHDGNDGTD